MIRKYVSYDNGKILSQSVFKFIIKFLKIRFLTKKVIFLFSKRKMYLFNLFFNKHTDYNVPIIQQIIEKKIKL